MGEQLMWRASPSAEAVQRQLLALQDQWQLLKQTAASQSKALGGLRSLQDFNRKAERLEAWIKHKVWGWESWSGEGDSLPVSPSSHTLAWPRRRSPLWQPSFRKAQTRSSSPAASLT